MFAQDGGVLGTRYEKPDLNSVVRNSESFGMSNSEMTEPGDFAVTGGLSATSRAWNPTGQVDPGTSNSPGPSAGVSNRTQHLKQRASETPGPV